MSKVIPDAAPCTEIIQESAAKPCLCSRRFLLEKLLYVLEVRTVAGRGSLDELLPAVGISKTGFTNAFEDIVFSFYSHNLDVAIGKPVQEVLTMGER